MRVQLSLLSILMGSGFAMVSGLACDRQDDREARSIQCGAAGFRSLPGDDCPCEPGLRSLTGDCVPDDGSTGDSGDSDECRADGSNCGDSGADTNADTDECRRADGSPCDTSADTGADTNADTGEPPPPASCGYRTQTQGGWGSACNGQNPGCLRDAHFGEVFPEGLYIGCGALTANLTNSLAVELALPTGGKPRALYPTEAVGYDGVGDPQVKTVLFGQVVALSLSVGFDGLPGDNDIDPLLPLSALQIADPDSLCVGMLVHEVLTQANYALGGCPSQLSVATATDCLTAINESFVDGGDTCSALFGPPPAL